MPSVYDRLRWWLTRAFRTGPLVVDRVEADYGHDQSTYAPEEYGHYSATSVGVYACATLRADNLSGLPLRLWRRDGRGNQEEVNKGKLYDLLQRVNPYWTWGRLINMTELSLCLWGQAFWVLERGKTGRQVPSEIWWARPDRMKPIPHPDKYLAGYKYEYGGDWIPFRPDEVVWLRYPNPMDEYSGLSPIAAARLAIDTSRASMKSNKNLFDKGMQLGGIISPEDRSIRMSKEQTDELEMKLERRFQGVDKAHRWWIVSGGLKAMPIGLSPKDAEFIQLMQWTLNDTCRVYRVPPPMVQDFTRSTYDNNEQADKSLWQHCLIPEGRFLAGELTEQLLPLFPGEADGIELDTSSVLSIQEDRTEIVEQMAKLWQMGVPLNRLLQEFMPSLLPSGQRGYPWGEVGYLADNLLPAGNLPEQPAEEPASVEEGLQRAISLVKELSRPPKQLPAPRTKAIEFGSPEHERLYKAHSRRADRWEARVEAMLKDLWKRQQESVLARLYKAKQALAGVARSHGYTVGKDGGEVVQEPFDEARWGKEFKVAITTILTELVEEVGQTTLDTLAVGTAFDVRSPEAIRFLEGRAQRFAREVNQTTWDDLRRSLAAGIDDGESIDQLADRVRDTFSRYSAVEPDAVGKINRARLIARTETNGAANGGSLQAARQSGVVKTKTWIATLDERVRDTHAAAHGQTVPLDADFTVGGATGPGPGQLNSVREVVNCRCALTYGVDKE